MLIFFFKSIRRWIDLKAHNMKLESFRIAMPHLTLWTVHKYVHYQTSSLRIDIVLPHTQTQQEILQSWPVTVICLLYSLNQDNVYYQLQSISQLKQSND